MDVIVRDLPYFFLGSDLIFNLSASLWGVTILIKTLPRVPLPFLESYSQSAKYRGLFWMHWTRFRKAFSKYLLTFCLILFNMS